MRPGAVVRQRAAVRARPAARRGDAGRPRHDAVHHRRRGRQRERRQAGALGDRPPEGGRPVPQLPRRDRRRRGAHRRPAALAGGARRRRASCACTTRTRIAAPPARTQAGADCPICAGGPHLEEVLRFEGPESVAAVLLETVTGANGVLVPPPGYLASIREVCDRHGILLILDEVMTGFGRTGRWFGCEHWDVTPGHHDARQGHQRRRRAARRRGREREAASLAGGARVRERAHRLRPPARLRRRRRDHRGAARRAAGGERGGDGRGARRRAAGARRRSPVGRRGPRASGCSGVSSWCATARPASRWCRTPRRERPRSRWRPSGGPPWTAASTSSRTATSCMVAPPLIVGRDEASRWGSGRPPGRRAGRRRRASPGLTL